MKLKIDRARMKLDAKEAMREHRPSVYAVTLVFLVIVWILEILSRKLQFPGMELREILQASFDDAMMERAITMALRNQTATGTLLGIAIDLMTIFLGGGFTLLCLNVAKRMEAGFGTLFELFAYFFRFLWLNILIGLFVFLWSLLLVIPGIIAAYRYSMAAFIFFDDPSKGAMQCIRESKEMTRGYKGQLFVLDLSFLGWIILSIIPLVSIYTRPYIGVTHANYYRVLSGQMDAQQTQQTWNEPWQQQ